MSLALRASFLLAGTAAALAAAPAAAQVSDNIVLNIMRECARIDDPTARLACYDNNIRAAGGNPSSVPGQMPAPSGGAAVLQPSAPGGFGADDLRRQSPERFNPNRAGASEVSAQVTAVTERQPGVYLVTLGSGAQWLFAETVGRDYRPPQRGETVEIQRAALGSYLLVSGRQQGVRVTRVK
ncbi:MAG: hypothetical protein ACO1OD_08935 [Croceibacterium sp.]